MLKRLALCFLILSLGSPGIAARKKAASCNRVYDVGVSNFPPLFSRDEYGKPTGIDFDLITEILKNTGCRFTMRSLTRPEIASLLNRGRIDIALTVSKQPVYELNGEFVLLFEIYREIAVRKEKVKNPFASFKEIYNQKDLKFGNLIGSTAMMKPEDEELLIKENRLIKMPDAEGIFKLMAEKRVDAVVATPLITRFFRDKFKLENEIVFFREDVNPAPIGIILSTKTLSEAERKQLKDSVKAMRANKKIIEILKNNLKSDDFTPSVISKLRPPLN
ncbi:substrate-binding periplasmic protein [Bdellovibrio bacteriovorus]